MTRAELRARRKVEEELARLMRRAGFKINHESGHLVPGFADLVYDAIKEGRIACCEN